MAGRPSKYTPEAVEIIRASLAQGDARITACKKAGISQDSFNRWLDGYADFAAIVKTAEEEYHRWEMNDILSSAKKSLKVLIEGQEYEETKTEYEQDPEDPSKPRVKRQTTTTKKVLPNATAVIFALVNRDPEHWQNRISNEVTGRLTTEQKSDISLANVPDDLLEKVIKSITGEE